MSIENRLASLGGDASSALHHLHDRLAAGAEAEGLLEVTYRTIDTAVGRLLLAATERGLVRVAYEREGHDDVLDSLATAISPRILSGGTRLDPVARELEEYFAGRRTGFDLPLDLRLASGFRREVIERLPGIAYGATMSYGQVAELVGNPRAVRAVGSACGHNPLPVVVPCHRVVRADGQAGGYVGGTDAKRILLGLEAG